MFTNLFKLVLVGLATFLIVISKNYVPTTAAAPCVQLQPQVGLMGGSLVK